MSDIYSRARSRRARSSTGPPPACPIALFPATSEREKISFHQLNKKTGHRIHYRKVDAETGDEVDSADIITAPAQPKATATTQRVPEAQRTTDNKKLATTHPQASPPQQEPNAEPPPDAGGARTTNLLIGAAPTVPAGGFENRFGPRH
jgi:hypothetical protein